MLESLPTAAFARTLTKKELFQRPDEPESTMAIVLLALVTSLVVATNMVSASVNSKIAAAKTQLETNIGEVRENLKDLTNKIELLSQSIYFKATFQGLEITSKPDQTVVFDKVLDNMGNAYQPSTGVFTAPRPGVYVFAVQMFARGSVDAVWDLHLNNERVVRARLRTQEDTSNEYVFPVKLRAGDRVSVFGIYAFNCWGTDHSFFAGWILMSL